MERRKSKVLQCGLRERENLCKDTKKRRRGWEIETKDKDED